MKKRTYSLTFLFLAWGLLAGAASPIQTSVNTQLREVVGYPYIAALISFATGTCFLALIVLLIDHTIKIDFAQIRHMPKWIWVGGMLGVVFVTANVLLLPVLGSAFTVVSLLFRQMIAALSVDHFGLFGVPKHAMNWPRAAGLGFMILGIILIHQF
ncbi:DMT family transporter [Sporolactobacillus terrae]|uniref:DMT family transporter n=1 Tax=Sporolactobacillus terrae TaxID=269673 RepID=UPI00048E6CEE|nr:DMT family transporter [Sporolactobacillus terrae]